MFFYNRSKETERYHIGLLAVCTQSVLAVHWCMLRQRGQDSGDLVSSCLVWPAGLKVIFFLCNLLSLVVPLNIYMLVYMTLLCDMC